MNYWEPSDRSRPVRTAGRSAALGLAVVLAAVPVSGCGVDTSHEDAGLGASPASTQTPAPPPTHSSRAPLLPGPSIDADASIAEDELVIEDANLAAVAAAVREEGGEVTKVVEEIGVSAARFDVSGRAELMRIRDDLRAAGFDATVSPLLRNPGSVTGAE